MTRVGSAAPAWPDPPAPVTEEPVTGTQAGGPGSDLLPSLRAFAIPMRTRFRGITVREGALIEGPAGWGEFSPFAEYGPRECARWLACALEAATPAGRAPVRDRVPVNVTVPAVGPEQAHAIVTGVRLPHRQGQGGRARASRRADDVARVEAVRDALGPHGRIRVDANGAWDVGPGAAALRELGRFGLEYAEQPCATLAELAELRRRVDVPLAADESIRRAEDPLAVRAAGAADIVVLKAQPLGGVRAALAVAAACGLPVVVSSAVETSVGLAAGVALAAALPELRYACGLATMSLLTGDVTAVRCWPRTASLPVRAARRRPAAPGGVGGRSRALAGARCWRPPGTWMRAGESRPGAAVNPATAFATVLVDELARCGLAEAVLAPGSRSAPLAMALGSRPAPQRGAPAAARADRRAVGRVPRAGAGQGEPRRPVAVVCTSGTAAAHFHAAVIEADEAGCRCSCSPPTGRRSCAAPARTRRSTSSSCTGTRCAGSARSACPRRGRG